MSAPNIESATVPNVVTGGVFGSIVGATAVETVGFYGSAGVAKQSATGVTTVAGLLTLLENLGLLSA